MRARLSPRRGGLVTVEGLLADPHRRGRRPLSCCRRARAQGHLGPFRRPRWPTPRAPGDTLRPPSL